jgi:AraC-like DNA-binding protein
MPSRSAPGRARSSSGARRGTIAERPPYGVDDVRQAVAVLLGRRCPDIHLVADTMLTSPRTLQRRLHSAGLTYAHLVAEARRASAERLLAEPKLTIAEVGRMLGYSDPAHFTRAFQRWTGVSPRAFRASLAGAESSDAVESRRRRS